MFFQAFKIWPSQVDAMTLVDYHVAKLDVDNRLEDTD